MILLSIIVPVFNCEKTIERTLNSIIFQLDDYSELIIVNDGSLDNSKAEIERLVNKESSRNIKIIEVENSGAMLARKEGLDASNGLYIWYVDGGDEISKDSVNKIIDNINQNEDIDIFYLNHITNAEKGKIEYHEENPDYICDNKNILLGTSPLSLCFRVLKKDLLINCGAYNINHKLTLLEDGCVSIEAVLRSEKVFLIKEYLYIYNRESESQSNSLIGYKSLIIALDFLYDYIGKEYKGYEKELDYFLFNNTVMKVLLTNTGEYGKELLSLYFKRNIKNNKYIKFKKICETLSRIKVLF